MIVISKKETVDKEYLENCKNLLHSSFDKLEELEFDGISVFNGFKDNLLFYDNREKSEAYFIQGDFYSFPGAKSRESFDERFLLGLLRKKGKDSFKEIDGKFWGVILDYKNREVYLLVDKFGVEALFFKVENGCICISPKVEDLISKIEFDSIGVGFYMIQGYVPRPKTVYRNIYVVPGANFVCVELDSLVDRKFCFQRYWSARRQLIEGNASDIADFLYWSIEEAVLKRTCHKNAVLISGGLDSAIALDILHNHSKNPIAITGKLEGYISYDADFMAAEKLTRYLGIPHIKVTINPNDKNIIEKWEKAVSFWKTASPEGLLLWFTMMEEAKRQIGEGGAVFSSETADRLAENELTGSNIGTLVARFFYSDLLFRFFDIPIFGIPKFIKKHKELFITNAKRIGLGLPTDVLTSILESWGNRLQYFYGLIFPGKSELPGIQDMVINDKFLPVRPGFEILKEWMDENYVIQFLGKITPDTYFYDFIKFRLAWCVQGVNMRVISCMADCHRLKVALPFLDTNVVNVFSSLPSWTRRFYKRPKHFLRYAAKRNSKLPSFTVYRRADSPHPVSHYQILLEGILGPYVKELLKPLNVLDKFDPEVINIPFVQKQIEKFISNKPDCRYDVIMQCGILELWNKLLAR